MAQTSQDSIVVVSGLPRSGTSMMMRMLEAGGLPVLIDHVREPDEDNPHGYYELEAVKQLGRNRSWLAGAPGKAVKVIYRLLRELPAEYEYSVIFLERRLEEVLASQSRMLAHRQKEHAAAHNARLAASFRRELERTKAWLRAQANFQVLYVSYHAVVKDPLSAAGEIARFLGHGLDVRAMSRVVDSNLYRHRC